MSEYETPVFFPVVCAACGSGDIDGVDSCPARCRDCGSRKQRVVTS